MTVSLKDRQAVADLVASYNHAIDHFEAEAWAETFTADGSLTVDGEERARGHAGLIAYAVLRRAAGFPILRHWVNNLLVTGNASSVRLRSYVMAFRLDQGLEAPAVMGEYDDDLVKVDGAWRFQCRRLTIVALAPPQDRARPEP